MPLHPGDWTKQKLSEILDKTKAIRNDGLKPSPGDIWSIKKIMILDYLIDGFQPIFNKWFKNFYYVDTHCGSGLIAFKQRILKEERFPGSAIISALRNPTKPFTDYFFSDIDSESISALNNRLKDLGAEVGKRSYVAEERDFDSTVKLIESYVKYGNAFFVFVDPTGFTEIHWSLMKRLLSVRTADIVFTFMTHVVARHRANVKPGNKFDNSLNVFYGNCEWRTLTKGFELMTLYRKQIEKYKDYVYDIPFFQKGKVLSYNILVATNSKGASNIIESARKIANVKTETIDGCFKVVTKKIGDLTPWLESK